MQDRLRRVVWDAAGFNQAFHAHEIGIEAPLRVRTERGGDAVPDLAARRVVRHADVHSRVSVTYRVEAYEARMRDRGSFNRAPGECLVRHKCRDLRIELHRNARRPGDGPVRLALASGRPYV
jgi:hypothetical protein